MNLNIQHRIFSDETLHRYLWENSYWYKILNRNPYMIDNMIQEMKDRYKLNTSDKLERFSDRLTMLESLLEVLK